LHPIVHQEAQRLKLSPLADKNCESIDPWEFTLAQRHSASLRA